MTLEQHIEDIRAGIRAGRFGNEASVSQGIVLRLLHALSWPAYDTQIVCPEWRLTTQDLPHHYRVAATARPEGSVDLASAGLEPISSAAPAEYGGPGDRWSPETLLVATVADCFVLSFRAIARASKLSWLSLNCDVEGTLARIEGTTKFTEFPATSGRQAHRTRLVPRKKLAQVQRLRGRQIPLALQWPQPDSDEAGLAS